MPSGVRLAINHRWALRDMCALDRKPFAHTVDPQTQVSVSRSSGIGCFAPPATCASS
jgi:hypothetical protein